ncbi:MAG TPA: 6-phosphofructokinase [Candidatus Onthovicinus excrementipullorum]|nr:6-phosphofructokinase [Candidatus Onthovicinus excrementipullorum]
MKKIGILTSGGDCQGLNPALRGLAKALYERLGDVELYGFADGYRGLIENDCKLMHHDDFSHILTQGGTILGTSRQPFKLMRTAENEPGDKVEAMKRTYREMGLDALAILGGNGTHKTANLLWEEGLNIVTLPKTIDNDLWGTDVTFGFHSALNVATNVIDCIRTTATSHGRIFIVEIMGHKVGWLALYAGLAGGADIILLPEIPYSVEEVAKALKPKTRLGKSARTYSIIAVAEGAMTREYAAMGKKERKKHDAAHPCPSKAYALAEELRKYTQQEIRVCVPGHIQRGGSPVPFDRALSTRLGAAAAELIREEKYGYMVAVRGEAILPVPLGEVAGKLKYVPVDCDAVRCARDIGICLGD